MCSPVTARSSEAENHVLLQMSLSLEVQELQMNPKKMELVSLSSNSCIFLQHFKVLQKAKAAETTVRMKSFHQVLHQI